MRQTLALALGFAPRLTGRHTLRSNDPGGGFTTVVKTDERIFFFDTFILENHVQLSLLSPLLHLLCVSLVQILPLFVCPPSLYRNLLADYRTLQLLSLLLLLLRLSLPLLFRLFA